MERQRKARHDRWLDQMLGAQRMFPWGEAGSDYDPKTGDSGIILRYSLMGQPWKGRNSSQERKQGKDQNS